MGDSAMISHYPEGFRLDVRNVRQGFLRVDRGGGLSLPGQREYAMVSDANSTLFTQVVSAYARPPLTLFRFAALMILLCVGVCATSYLVHWTFLMLPWPAEVRNADALGSLSGLSLALHRILWCGSEFAIPSLSFAALVTLVFAGVRISRCRVSPANFIADALAVVLPLATAFIWCWTPILRVLL